MPHWATTVHQYGVTTGEKPTSAAVKDSPARLGSSEQKPETVPDVVAGKSEKEETWT